jgi:hypothetical protein
MGRKGSMNEAVVVTRHYKPDQRLQLEALLRLLKAPTSKGETATRPQGDRAGMPSEKDDHS